MRLRVKRLLKRLDIMCLALFISATVLTTTAQAGAFKSSYAFMEKCSSEKPSDWGICLGYVQGVADSLETLKGWGVPFEQGYACFPESIKGEELRDTIVDYMAVNPDLLPYAAAGVAKKALVAAYPCEQE